MANGMKRGRPTYSIVRQRIVDILHHEGRAYGYQIHKIYKKIFPPVTLRVIYYHLRKGVELGEFKVETVETAKGEYSWGSETQKTFYTLGPEAKPSGDELVASFFAHQKQ
ncbi:hypothetical protein D6783_02025 [Candidatus Woesearchaeota archaeon]|nr:MAG: hypothetical protein D6783_02025 [Candidatus Woesearchaeota archaeon]